MPTIDIRTTQNVVIQYELATVIDRLVAFLLDLAILIAAYLFLFFVSVELFGNFLYDFGNLIILFAIFGLVFYQFLSEVLADGQSWGKRALGIKVVRLDGEQPGLSDYLLRAVFHLPDSLFSVGLIGTLLISATKKRQRLGDLTANTTVIKVRSIHSFELKHILGIQTAENYQPIYPAVRNLSEQDMLLVKQTLQRYRDFQNAAHSKAMDALVARLCYLLQIPNPPRDHTEFLRTVLRDYIVLTR